MERWILSSPGVIRAVYMQKSKDVFFFLFFFAVVSVMIIQLNTWKKKFKLETFVRFVHWKKKKEVLVSEKKKRLKCLDSHKTMSAVL